METEKTLKYLVLITVVILLVNIYTLFTLSNLKEDVGYVKSDVTEIFYKVLR